MYFKNLFKSLAVVSLFMCNQTISAWPTSPIMSTTLNNCGQCHLMQEQINQLQELNMNLLKEVFVYRHILHLNDEDVQEVSRNMQHEMQHWIKARTNDQDAA